MALSDASDIVGCQFIACGDSSVVEIDVIASFRLAALHAYHSRTTISDLSK